MADSIIFKEDLRKGSFLAHEGRDKEHSSNQRGIGVSHVGSGRYETGSGEDPYQHQFDFYFEAQKLVKEYLGKMNPETGKLYSRTDIAKMMGYKSTKEWRYKLSEEKDRLASYRYAEIRRLREERQMSPEAIAERLHVSNSQVRSVLKASEDVKESELTATANVLRESLEKYGYIDVGDQVERTLGISKEKLGAAVKRLEQEGYPRAKIQVNQINPRQEGQKTTMIVLGPKGMTPHDVAVSCYDDLNKIHMINEYKSEDLGMTYFDIFPPVSVDSKRIKINYADENGEQNKDGVIELRPGVPDLSLGANQVYSQVRIAVDDKYYLKGMAVYNNKMPDGVDIIFNTNKAEGTPIEKVFKPLKRTKELPNGDPDPNSPIDKDNPFGSNIKAFDPNNPAESGQSFYTDKNGKKCQSAINKVNPEGTWSTWNKCLAAQFLSKQSLEFAEQQLKITYLKKQEEFEKVMSVTNDVVRKKMLLDFADECDASSYELKAAALPRQSNKVLLPLDSIKETECYCPDYRDGENLCLIRYPHSGPMEIVEVKVNNNNRDAASLYGKAPRDVIVINPKVAPKLSGADFDGDSVVVIPNRRYRNKEGKMVSVIDVRPMLKKLEGFDPKTAFPGYPGMKVMTERTKGIEMGKAANLIADMQLLGAELEGDEMARAIKYSMVVIDAKKHKLDWEAAKNEYGIRELRKKYQGKTSGGAATLLTRAGAEINNIPQRSLYTKIDPKTGKVIYRETGKMRKVWDKDEEGNWYVKKEEPRTSKSYKMLEADDAFELASDPKNPLPMEKIYGNYANGMKRMAAEARIRSEAISTSGAYKRSAAKAYQEEVYSIDKKLMARKALAPNDRMALRGATMIMKAKLEENPNMSKEERKKKGAQAMSACRRRCTPGGKKEKIDITPKEWEAIQAGAISATKLKSLLLYANEDQVRSYATPQTDKRKLSAAQIERIKAMINSKTTNKSDIAEEFGISVSTLNRYVYGE